VAFLECHSRRSSDEAALKGREKKIITASNKAKLLFVAAAGISFLFSVSLWFSGHREEGLFVGLWVPSILSLGGLLFASRSRSG